MVKESFTIALAPNLSNDHLFCTKHTKVFSEQDTLNNTVLSPDLKHFSHKIRPSYSSPGNYLHKKNPLLSDNLLKNSLVPKGSTSALLVAQVPYKTTNLVFPLVFFYKRFGDCFVVSIVNLLHQTSDIFYRVYDIMVKSIIVCRIVNTLVLTCVA